MTAKVCVEFPIEEAEAILEYVKQGPPDGMSEAAQNSTWVGIARLERAVNIERGPSGNSEEPPTVKQQAEALLGQNITLLHKDGSHEVTGKLERISKEDALIIEKRTSEYRVVPLKKVRKLGEAA